MREEQEAIRKDVGIPGVIAHNACDYKACSDGVTMVHMLGHSMNAVSIPRNGSVSYRFNTTRHGEVILRLATIPTHANDRGDIRFAVSIDGETPQVFSLKEPFRSERWKEQVLRGQAIREMRFFLTFGTHTLTVKALDDHILFDQWMIDFDTTRAAYTFPIRPTL